MSKYIINGGKPLSGEVSIRGAKNATYKEIIATLLSPQKSQITNISQITDVHITLSIAESLGSKVSAIGQHTIEIETPKIISSTVPHGTGEKSRTSFIFSAPLLARTGQAIIPFPGGDKLGARPLDRLFQCFESMNIKTEEKGDLIIFTTNKIKATNFTFSKPSHTVTETVIMAAVLAQGTTVLHNTALEPEIDDLITMLNSMGAKITRDKREHGKITITGVSSLHGTQHQVIADRNEAVTFACATLATKGSVNILRIYPKSINTFLNTIEKMGAQVIRGFDEVNICWIKPLKAVDVETGPEPGFMTDWQALFSLVLTQAVGCSSIIERVFPSRFQHIAILNQMEVNTKFFNPNISDPNEYYQFNIENDKPEYFHGVKIYGPTKLKSANIKVNDLRAGATATLAALTAPGKSVIEGVEFIERGYEKLADRLKSLGADIKYIKT